MSTRSVILFVLLPLFSLVLTVHVFASWADVPLDQVIEESDTVVVGEITRLGKPVKVNKRPFAVGVISVQATLKGTAVKEVSLAWPDRGAGGIAMSTDLSYRKGQKGVWLLSKDKAQDFYWATYPKDYQRLEKRKEIEALIAGLSNRSFSPAVNGLAAFSAVANLGPDGTVKGNAVGLSLILKNTTEEPIRFCTYVGDRPVRAAAKGPDGDTKIDFYEWLARARLAGCRANNFEVIQPGQTKRIGSYGVSYARNLQPGSYEFVVSFAAKRDGAKLGLKEVWTGTVSAPPIKVKVQK